MFWSEKKNRLASVGLTYFEKEHRKQERSFCLDYFIMKHITGFWMVKSALFGMFLLFIHITLWINTVF